MRGRTKVVVIGAGISGLACAFRLKQSGVSCLVFEEAERPGGLIATIRRDGFLFETGPQSPRFPDALWRLVRELDLESEFLAGDPKAKRYILRQGKLHRAPFSPLALVRTRLLGMRSKLRILAEPFGHSHPPAREESLADFVVRKFDTETLENLVDPFVSTIFLGDARKMGVRSAFPALLEWESRRGSLVRGALAAGKPSDAQSASDRRELPVSSTPARTAPRSGNRALHVTDALPALGSFQFGMATLPEKLSQELKNEIRCKARITSLAPVVAESGIVGWEINLAGGERLAAEHAVLAVPAHVAADLLQTSTPALASQLKAIEYAPICTVSSAYDRSNVANRLDGFGFMVPRREGLKTFCTFWSSSLFPGRAPQGTVLITSFAGRGEDDPLWDMTGEECAQTVESENARILGITGQPLDRAVWRNSHAMPQYNVGHGQRVAEIQRILGTLGNLHLAGNYLSGRSLGDCVDVASRVAGDLQGRLRR